MTKYQVKQLLLTKTRKQLNKVAKGVYIEKSSKLLKEDLINELVVSLFSFASVENISITEDFINAMCYKSIDSIIDEINMTNIHECCITELNNSDFDTQNKLEEVVTMTTTINTQNLELINRKVFAKLKTEQSKKNADGKNFYDFNERPSNILRIVLEQIKQVERLTDVAYVLTFGYPQGQEDYRGTCQLSTENILAEYDKEQNARREFAINNSMMGKEPSEGQLNAFAKVYEQCKTTVGILPEDLVKLELIDCDLSATAYSVKVAIGCAYDMLSNTPATEGQLKFMDSIVRSGISYGNNIPNTYGKARTFITESMPLFNRKCLIRDLQNQGVNGLDLSTIASFSDDKVKDYLYKVKKLANVLGMTFTYYKDNIWTLIETLNDTMPSKLLKIQEACMSKNEEAIIEELAIIRPSKDIVREDNVVNPTEIII